MHHNFTKTPKKDHLIIKAATVLALFMALLNTDTAVFASGKPVGKHRLLLVPALAYFYNTSYWDQYGHFQNYANGQRFGSTILSVNAEYGLTRRVSLVGSIPFISNTVSATGVASNTVSGLGDAEFGGRFYIANINYNYYFSVQGTLVVPLYTNSGTTSIGYDELGADLKFIAAGDLDFISKKLYFEFNTGIRPYFGPNGPFQYKTSLSLSYAINRKNQVSLAEAYLYSYSKQNTPLDVNNPLDVESVKDFAFNQITAAYAYSFARNKSLFFSVSQFITGRNVGVGTTFSVGYVYKY